MWSHYHKIIKKYTVYHIAAAFTTSSLSGPRGCGIWSTGSGGLRRAGRIFRPSPENRHRHSPERPRIVHRCFAAEPRLSIARHPPQHPTRRQPCFVTFSAPVTFHYSNGNRISHTDSVPIVTIREKTGYRRTMGVVRLESARLKSACLAIFKAMGGSGDDYQNRGAFVQCFGVGQNVTDLTNGSVHRRASRPIRFKSVQGGRIAAVGYLPSHSSPSIRYASSFAPAFGQRWMAASTASSPSHTARPFRLP